SFLFFFFFFQAEDGIRDFHVTGVQTCALPISFRRTKDASSLHSDSESWFVAAHSSPLVAPIKMRLSASALMVDIKLPANYLADGLQESLINAVSMQIRTRDPQCAMT